MKNNENQAGDSASTSHEDAPKTDSNVRRCVTQSFTYSHRDLVKTVTLCVVPHAGNTQGAHMRAGACEIICARSGAEVCS